ncbi:MAG: hypothetical protein DRQ47_07265 [Gammaproteobacteria bacterium]|nr:MAG: hypothetical protein DRQ47_07265 [Gammaproteobacteria bacterium]
MKWRDIPSSNTLKQLIQQQLDLVLPSVHGYSLVTLGELSAVFEYQAAAVANVLRINTSHQVDVCASFNQLPLASDDIDAIFLPLLIEQTELPHQLLREAVRSLRPGGKLILVAFNPMSIWGLYKLVMSRTGNLPWKLPFFRLGRLTDWLSLLGLEVTLEHGLFARPPGSEFHKHSQKIGSAAYSRFGAINFLVAEKNIKTLTPIRKPWKQPSVVSPSIIEPTRKNIGNT